MRKQTFLRYSDFFAVTLVVFFSLSITGVIYNVFKIDTAEKTSGKESREELSCVFIIDPGHGGEDGGAVGVCGSLEKDLNLQISQKLFSLISMTDCTVAMTRQTDKMLYMTGQEHRKKYYDLKNRVAVTSQFENPLFVSIHQNKFPVEKYHGLQVYYSSYDVKSREIAKNIQQNCKAYLQNDNNRDIKQAGRNIYVLKNIECPAVLVECGFLSNAAEEKNLCDDNYQKKLAFVIFKSIIEFSTKHTLSV